MASKQVGLGNKGTSDAIARAHALLLKSLIRKCPPGDNQYDEVNWRWKKYQIFTVKSAYKYCIDDEH